MVNVKSQVNGKNSTKTSESQVNNKDLIRNSLLVDLVEDRNFRTLYTLILTICCGLIFNHLFRNFVQHGRISIGQEIILAAFGKFHIVAILWFILFFYHLLLYWCYSLWVYIAMKIIDFKFSCLFDMFGISFYVLHAISALYFSTFTCFLFNLPCASSAVISMEGIRLSMKGYAFVRSNTPKIHQSKKISFSFSKYLYFLFAPTLVYQDTYCRTKKIRWLFILKSLAEFSFCIFALGVIYEQLIFSLSDFGIKKYSLIDIIQLILENSAVGGLLGFLGFLSVLHTWQNVFAELLRFGDRLFYKDWWSQKDLKGYYRTWNLIVQNWLYEYIYKDAYNYLFCQNKVATRFFVLFISAIFHELVLFAILGFFYPVLFILYISSAPTMYIRYRHDLLGNMVLLYSIAFGLSIGFTLYITEYFARRNCPINDKWYMPTTFTCLS